MRTNFEEFQDLNELSDLREEAKKRDSIQTLKVITLYPPAGKRFCDWCDKIVVEDGVFTEETVISRNLYCGKCFEKVLKGAKKYGEEKFYPEIKRYLVGDDATKEPWYIDGEEN